VPYEPGRISANVAQVAFFIFHPWELINNMSQVPHQKNSKDCGCFLIYFATKFMLDPEATLAIMKVGFIFFPRFLTDVLSQKSFSSEGQRLNAWGLSSSDLSFVRQDLRTLLLEYIGRKEAVVQFK
jgi:Ulp1 family protease